MVRLGSRRSSRDPGFATIKPTFKKMTTTMLESIDRSIGRSIDPPDLGKAPCMRVIAHRERRDQLVRRRVLHRAIAHGARERGLAAAPAE